MNNPNSLAGRVIKARYYPRANFMEATPGHQPSYAWRSLLKSRDQLKEGVRWNIGNGPKVRIWEDKWLQTTIGSTSLPLPSDLTPNSCVVSLIDEDTRRWKETMISHVFEPEIAKEILSIPSGDLQVQLEDYMVWKDSPNGEFSVKSAYRLT